MIEKRRRSTLCNEMELWRGWKGWLRIFHGAILCGCRGECDYQITQHGLSPWVEPAQFNGNYERIKGPNLLIYLKCGCNR